MKKKETLGKKEKSGKKLEEERRGSDSPPANQQHLREIHQTMDERSMSDMPGCSADTAYMQRKDWPSGRNTTSWIASESDNLRKAANVKAGHSIRKSRVISKSVSGVISSDSFIPRNRNIRLIENRQLVPPTHSPSSDNAWITAGKKERQKQIPVFSDNAPTPRKRPAGRGGAGSGKSGKKLLKRAVVTITGRPGVVSYAEILAKAREKVSLGDLGIETTVIRRAMNGAIIIEIPGPQGKQLASSLSASLAEALGEDAKVNNPVAMGDLRIRGIDPSTTTEEIRTQLETLGGCSRRDFKSVL